MATIALEEHFVTKDFLKATRTDGEHAPPALRAMQPKLLDVGQGRLASMRANGITMQVLSLAAIGFDDLDAATATHVAHDVNDEVASRVAEHPDHFAAFATLALKAPEDAAKELERCVRTLGFKGALVDGTTDGRFLDDPRFVPFWEAAVALEVPVYLHPAPPPAAVQTAYYAGLPGPDAKALGYALSIAGWGWHAETGLHALRLIVSGLFDQLPSLQLILGHMGEGLPYALARSSSVLSRAATQLERSVMETFVQQVHVTTSGYFTKPPFDCAEAVLGIDRMMFSVDYPFSPNEHGRQFLEALSPMEDDRRAKLTGANAVALLKISGGHTAP